MYSFCCAARIGNSGEVLIPRGPWQVEQRLTVFSSAALETPLTPCALAADDPTTRAISIAPVRVITKTPRAPFGRASCAGSKRDPYVEKQRVVVVRVAAIAVVVSRRSVELPVTGVLQHQPDVLDRHIIEFDDVAVAVGLACIAAFVKAVKTRVGAPEGAEIPERCAVLAVMVVRGLRLKRAKRVGRIRWRRS